jgi:hypothetical protein
MALFYAAKRLYLSFEVFEPSSIYMPAIFCVRSPSNCCAGGYELSAIWNVPVRQSPHSILRPVFIPATGKTTSHSLIGRVSGLILRLLTTDSGHVVHRWLRLSSVPQYSLSYLNLWRSNTQITKLTFTDVKKISVAVNLNRTPAIFANYFHPASWRVGNTKLTGKFCFRQVLLFLLCLLATAGTVPKFPVATAALPGSIHQIFSPNYIIYHVKLSLCLTN